MSACTKDIGKIIRLFEESVTIRKGGTPVIDPATGRLVQPVPVAKTMVVKAAIYPATERDARLLPEGSRVSASIVLFAEIRFESNDKKLNKVGDIIEYNGEDFEIFRSEDWNNLGTFYKHIAVKTVT
jgi:hypothetical protein